jgi:hypothetical protein
MLNQKYTRWIYEWENHLCFRSTDRVVRPFDWGLDWTAAWPAAPVLNGHSPEQFLFDLNRTAIGASEEFFGYQKPSDFTLKGDHLQFTSAVRTPHPENNTVHGLWFPGRPSPWQGKSGRSAVVVLPHWNAKLEQHQGLCRGISQLGIGALRISLPYHDLRLPKETARADYAVSSNVGRTIDATRQAVIDVRSCVDWLQAQGYERFGIVGTSLGSCYAFLASAHDERLTVNAFNHCSTYFADVVWTGLSTQHIRKSMEDQIDLDTLRECWRAISPVSYMSRFAEAPKKSLFVYTKFDTTFLPEFSRDVVDRIREHGLDHRVVVLPCGHYTLGESPFKFLDGYHICSFLKSNL